MQDDILECCYARTKMKRRLDVLLYMSKYIVWNHNEYSLMLSCQGQIELR